MTKEELKNKIAEICPSATYDDTGEWLQVMIDGANWLPVAWQLRANQELAFDYLFCVTAVDWKIHFSMVYHLRSFRHDHIVVVKAKIERAKPEIESVAKLWRTAELNEREAYDLMGIQFKNHPDLRRLFMSEDWEGYPLRKDYVDEVNIIKL